MNERSPKISIVTVSFNQDEYIEENILSVINQNYANKEHIIIDAGSTDRTISILKKYDSYLNWISEPDKGQSDGLNKGFKKASGDIIGWINSDDRLAQGAMEKVAKYFFENPEENAVVGDQILIDESGAFLNIVKSHAYDYFYLLNKAKGITQNSTFFKKSVFQEIGYLDESLHYAMDHDFFIRLSTLGSIKYISETLAEFRIQPNAKTAQGIHLFAKEMILISRKYNGNQFSSFNLNNYYIILTQPLRQIKWLRILVQEVKSIFRS